MRTHDFFLIKSFKNLINNNLLSAKNGIWVDF